MNDTQSKLKNLLSYWLEHNGEHREEFQEWAVKIAGEHPGIADQLRQAVDKMAEADQYLKKAQQLLK
jgi:hypothetical protein